MTTPENTDREVGVEQQNPTVVVAKKRRSNTGKKERTLSTGVRVRLHPVSAALIAEVTSRLKYPKVPKVFNEKKGREEENPVHPDYIAEKQEIDNQRGIAAMDAMAMFGVELVDGVPEGDWARKLQLLGIEFDAKDDVEREFCYKKHIALSGGDYALLGRLSGLTEEAITAAAESFRGN